jgi:hypothetical protein
MQLEDVVFYGLGAAFVAGVSGFVDFSGLFGGKSGDEGADDNEMVEGPRANPDNAPSSRTDEYQSTLAYILQDEPESLLSLRAAEQVAEPEPELVEDDTLAGFEDGNIFGEVSETPEDMLYESVEEGAVIDVYDLDPDMAAAHIDGFDAGSEALEIEYLADFDPETGAPLEPEVSVAYDAEADLTTIALDGAAVAELPGDAGLTAADITLRPMA